MEMPEAVVAAIDTFNRNDIEGFVAICTPDVELRSLRGMVEDLVYRGPDGLRQFQRDSEATWSDRHLDLVELEARGDEAVFLARIRLKGLASGVTTEQDVAFAFRLSDGLIALCALHADAESARRELGWSS
jgi:ketosteroid isomerase-like protein